MNAREVTRTTLPNGLRVITEPMPHVRSVSIGVWIGTGARREKASENGISHFIEHMLFKGTDKRSAEEIAREVDSTGGHLDAYTAKELVSYNTKVIDDHLPIAFDVLADMVLHPLFAPEDIEKEKGVILEELKMEVDNAEYLVHETFFSNFWKNHPLGRSILGTKSDHQGIRSRSGRRTIIASVYAPIESRDHGGGHDWNTSRSSISRRITSALCNGNDSVPAEREPRRTPPLILKNKRSLEQMHLCLGVPAYPDRRRAPLRLLSAEHGPRRRYEFAAVSEHPREARACLLDLLGAEPLSRYRLPGCLRRHVA